MLLAVHVSVDVSRCFTLAQLLDQETLSDKIARLKPIRNAKKSECKEAGLFFHSYHGAKSNAAKKHRFGKLVAKREQVRPAWCRNAVFFGDRADKLTCPKS